MEITQSQSLLCRAYRLYYAIAYIVVFQTPIYFFLILMSMITSRKRLSVNKTVKTPAYTVTVNSTATVRRDCAVDVWQTKPCISAAGLSRTCVSVLYYTGLPVWRQEVSSKLSNSTLFLPETSPGHRQQSFTQSVILLLTTLVTRVCRLDWFIGYDRRDFSKISLGLQVQFSWDLAHAFTQHLCRISLLP